jgi:hypothetical protein
MLPCSPSLSGFSAFGATGPFTIREQYPYQACGFGHLAQSGSKMGKKKRRIRNRLKWTVATQEHSPMALCHGAFVQARRPCMLQGLK